ncbi:MAG: glycosyltransferase [Ruminococcus sp.]|nr:glycosyltransferase [Ruminococcus sp.]
MAKRVLILSGKDPSHSGNLGQNLIDSLKWKGYEVSFDFPDTLDYLKKVNRIKNSFWGRTITKGIIETNRLFRTSIFGLNNYYSKKGYVFFHANEDKPPYDYNKIIEYAKGKFDLIITLFPNDLFNIKSLGEISKKTGIPIFICPPDMYPMTGGCIYFDRCDGYKRDCEYCPVFKEKRYSQANKNYLIKKEVYQRYDITMLLNTWMKNAFIKSNLFRNNQLQKIPFVLDENLYRPLNRISCRSEIGIPNRKIVFLIRHTSQKRKGNNIAYNALKKLYDSLEKESKKDIMLLTIGEIMTEQMPFETKNLGFVNLDPLIKAYNSADAFLCPSVDDAGPSMINQSIACGTPVVSFNSGTAIDVIENGISGFKTDNISEEGFFFCLKQMYDAIAQKKETLRKTSREMSLKNNSLKVFATTIDGIIKNKLINN